MITQFTKFKSKNKNSQKYGYIPVQNSYDYRKSQQNDWKFRLNAEFLMLKKKSWNIAFCTLTYNEQNLPKIPKILFNNKNEYKSIPCFSKTDIQNWIHSVRQYFKYHNGFKNGKNIRYFIASEYGSTTHRPHYHAIIAWPNEVSYKLMHAVCTEKWNHGYMFPRNVNGDKDILPFEIVGDMSKALNYVSKYACKDITFCDEIKKLNLNRKLKIYKNIQSFHIQSKSIGYEIIKNMSENEKINAFRNGIAFQGDGKIYKIPLYIKNRIVFDNYYIVKPNGERLVKRKASEFFEKYKKELFIEKSKFYEKVFQETNEKYLIERGVDEKWAKTLQNAINYYKDKLNTIFGFDLFGSGVFGQYYMCYYGINNNNCRAINNIDEAIEQWMRRYRENVKEVNENEVINKDCWESVQECCNIILSANTFCNIVEENKNTKQETLNKKLTDYYNNVLKGLI